jgi:hypothetical protein
MALKKSIVPIEDAIKKLNEAWNWDPVAKGKDYIVTGTVYNCFNKKRLTRHGSFHNAMVDLEELLREFGPPKSKGA